MAYRFGKFMKTLMRVPKEEIEKTMRDEKRKRKSQDHRKSCDFLDLFG
jgi:hypothetical protein